MFTMCANPIADAECSQNDVDSIFGCNVYIYAKVRSRIQKISVSISTSPYGRQIHVSSLNPSKDVIIFDKMLFIRQKELL
jgi:hypothetical protein